MDEIWDLTGDSHTDRYFTEAIKENKPNIFLGCNFAPKEDMWILHLLPFDMAWWRGSNENLGTLVTVEHEGNLVYSNIFKSGYLHDKKYKQIILDKNVPLVRILVNNDPDIQTVLEMIANEN